jgi:uncharacterized protein YjgD (DUF1641 family)
VRKLSRQSRQRRQVANNRGRDAVTRVDTLEKAIKSQGEQLAKLYELVSKMKADFDNLVGISTSKAPHFQNVYGVRQKAPNPWALETSRSLTQAMNALDDEVVGKRMKKLLEAYKPTLEALRTKPEGLTADEVKEKTGRSRNIESSYLWKLYLAGYATRERSHAKVVYKLKASSDLAQILGSAAT